MNWLLILVLVILIWNTLLGMKAGFIKMVFSLLSIVVALVLTILISPRVNTALEGNEKFHTNISTKVEKALTLEKVNEKGAGQDEYIESLPLPKYLKESLKESKDKGIQDIKAYATDYITGIIITSIAFITTFVVILIVLWILCFALDIISKLPLLHQINKTAGLAAGLVHGLVIVWLMFIFFTAFGGYGFGQNAFVLIEKSPLLSLLYDNNLLLRVVVGASKIFL